MNDNKNSPKTNSKFQALFTDEEIYEEDTETITYREDTNPLLGQPSQEELEAQKRKKRKKIILISVGITLALLLIIYLGGLIFYSSHFLPGTYINGIRVGSQTNAQAINTINTRLTDREVTIIGENGVTNRVSGGEIGLEFEDLNELSGLISKQNKFLWPFDFLIRKHNDITTAYNYNQDFLQSTVENLSLVAGQDVKAPVDASFSYNGNEFTMVPSQQGDLPNVTLLEKAIENALVNNIESIDLEAEGLYQQPALTENSQIMQDNLQKLNTAIKANITISFPGSPVNLNKEVFNSWLIADNNGVSLNQDSLNSYVQGLASNYNTAGRTYSFRTNGGQTLSFINSNGGYILNQEEEAKQLNTQILAGQTITDNPIWSQASGGYIAGNQLSGNYIEVSISRQTLWLYKNNSMISSSTIVSGNVATGQSTATGLYYIQSKNVNTNMAVKLPDGSTINREVNFWFPYAGNIGIESGSWRTSFGGSIYQNQGTDGDIDVPMDMGQTLISNIEVNYPVIIY